MGSLRARKETPLDVAWRYRSVVALISVPVLLIATVALMMPRGPAPGGFHDAVAPARRAGAGGDGRRYAVVIDAGSTGSRVHAFSFRSGPGGSLELLDDAFTQLKPGLSSYAASPAEGGGSLRPLLDAAAAAVPAAAAPDTPVLVRATAGLRLLPGTQAEQLLSGASRPRPAATY
jgi:apyrase